MGTSEIADLLARALAGNLESRALLLAALRPRMVLWAATRLPRTLARTVTPETFAADALHHAKSEFETFRGGDMAAFHAWLFKRSDLRVQELLLAPGGEAGRRMPSHPTAICREDVVRVQGALLRLPIEHRDVIRLCRIEGLHPTEAAERLGRRPEAVRLLYCRALQGLAREMDGNGRR